MLARTAARVRRLVRGVRLSRAEAQRLVQVGYRVALRRGPDPDGLADFSDALRAGRLTPAEFLLRLWVSPEGHAIRRHPYPDHGAAAQAGRETLARFLPRAEVVLDLSGDLLALGYPYPFRSLTVLLPPRPGVRDEVESFDTPRGGVRCLRRPPDDLGPIAPASVDLVFAADPFVRACDAEAAFAEVHRVLRTGGAFCLDVRNPVLERIERGADPPRVNLPGRIGFEVVERKGVGWMPETVRTGRFDPGELIRHTGVYDDAANCYRLYYRYRRIG